MKDQYFGDENDYRKYGLLRALTLDSQFKVLVAWMLTPNDDGPDGRFRSYRDDPSHWRRFDPELYDGLVDVLPTNSTRPSVSLIEGANLLPRAQFFSDVVPDARVDRAQWGSRLVEAASDSIWSSSTRQRH